jgi:hypothetical protein
MRKLIIAGLGLTLLVLAGVGFWTLSPIPRAERELEEAHLKEEASRLQPVEAQLKEAEAEHDVEARDVAAAPRRAASRKAAAEAKRKAAEAEAAAEAKAKAAPSSPLPPASAAINQSSKIEAAGQALERLPKGKIVLDAPKTMKVGDTRAVYANVGINVPIELLRAHSRPTDQSHEAVLSVSSEMAAMLTGPGFAITPTTPEQQGVAEGYPTIWSWNVEAKQVGEQELEATLYVLLPVGDKSTRQRIDSYAHKIGVSVKEQSWAEWLKSSKEEVEAVHVIAITLGSAVMAVLGWLGLSYSRRRQTENRNQTEAT